MTTETRKRIRAYKKALPELRERVIAVALLLAMSVSMLASASFAWITLSVAPEVTGMQTTVAANGNLEIALAQGSTQQPAVAPGESQVGDSSAAEDQSIVGANVTWGNLVNVSDPSYGLSQIALRPALLSAYNRTEYPLNGATYGGDGRVVTTNDRYEFASYTKVDGADNYYFAAGEKVNYGVRAISSVGYANYSGNVRVDNFRNDTNQLYYDAYTKYGKIVSDGADAYILDEASGVTCISALEGLVTVFAQDKINAMGLGRGENTKTSCSPYLWYLYQMMLLLQEVLDDEGKALLEMANWQAYVASGDAKTEKTFASVDALLAATSAQLTEKGVTLSTLASYKKSISDLAYCINGIKPMAEKCQNPDAPEETYYWENISSYVNRLVEINTTTMNGIALKDAGAKNALQLIRGGDVIVYNGALVDIEKRLVNNEYRVQAAVKVKAYTSILGEQTVRGTVYTDAFGDEPGYSADIAHSDSLESSAKGDASAKDTYGLAIDVWVRTNHPDAVLTLEGSAKYEDQRATITSEGKKYELYTITIGEGDTQTEVDVYKNGDTWYYASNHSEVSSEDMGSQTPKEKYVPVIVGYEGENRIWEDWRSLLEAGYIEQDATTQGAGSCFVFYADTPTEQAKIMEMLEAFNVAFIDQDGDILGTAQLNLDSAYANQGKVTVPLEVITGIDYTDESGASHIGITSLTQNTPVLVTAIIYLNGSRLRNENVLADGELQGQLNIQFGTSATLVAPGNEELQAQARTITATVTANGQSITDGTIGGETGLDYKPQGYKTVVKLDIEGEQPERISGFFVRVINSTQGTRGEEVDFVPNADGTWTAEFTLTNPGKYAFNTLLVDGVQYTLHDGTVLKTQNEYYPSNRPYVYIKGLNLTSASVDVAPGTYMTADTSKAFNVTAVVDAAVEPKQVTAQFFSEDNSKQYTAILTRSGNSSTWTGTANINSSGTYSLKYISVDGQILDAPALGSYTLYLGLTARVSTTLPENDWNFPYTGATQITMRARIFDDSGAPIENLSGVELTYNNIVSPAALTWQSAGYYQGVFDIIQPGELTFKSLKLGSVGTLYSVPTSPTFWAMSLEKPEYLSASTKGSLQTVIGSTLNATMSAEMKNAETASVYAQIDHVLNGKTTTYYVPATGSGNSRTFNLPKLDGQWTMKALLLQNVYDPDYDNGEGNAPGKWFAKPESESTDPATYSTTIPAGDHLILTTDAVTTEVVATYNLNLYYDANNDGNFTEDEKKTSDFTVNLSGTKDNPTGTLLQGYSPNALGIVVTDYKGRAITGVNGSDASDLKNSKTKLVITYDPSTDTTYGSYDGAAVANIDAVLNLSADGTMLTSEKPTLIHSGEYTATVTVDVAGQVNTLDVNPKFTIATKKPTLKVTNISTKPGTNSTVLTGTRASDGTVDYTTDTTGDFFRYSDYSAVVYITVNPEWRLTAYLPEVELTLSDMPTNAFSASVVFENDSNAEYNKTYTFTQNELVKSNQIGFKEDGGTYLITTWSPKLFPAGMQTVDEITVTYNGVPLTVKLSNPVTINQPQCPAYVDVASTGTNGVTLQTTPSRIFGVPNEDGVFEITLPASQTWTTNNTTNVDGEYEQYGDAVTTNGYTVQDGGCDDDTYTAYTLVTTTYRAVSASTTWTTTHRITGWKVGNTTYSPSQTIAITSNQTITAIIESVDGEKTTTTKTATKQYLDYTTGSSGLTSRPSGSNWSNTNLTDRWTEPTYS